MHVVHGLVELRDILFAENVSSAKDVLWGNRGGEALGNEVDGSGKIGAGSNRLNLGRRDLNLGEESSVDWDVDRSEIINSRF